jgi:cytoskeletal protein CcmA (bactofilin family)
LDNQTVVGPQTRIAGDVRGEGDLLVRGRVTGRIQLTETLFIERGAIVEADVDVRSLVVAGVLVGSIRASQRVRLADGARVVADLSTPRLVIEPGAAYRGRVQMPMQVDDGDEPARRRERVRAPAAATRWPIALSGALEQVGITSLLTLMELERRSGLLELRSQRHLGEMTLIDGFVVGAVFDGVPVTSCDAVCQYLRWSGGRFSFRPGEGEPGAADEPVVPTTLLLLEAARRTDETYRGSHLLPADGASSDGPAALGGALDHFGVNSVLTLLEMERRVGVLEVRSRRHLARLSLCEGLVTAAILDGQAVPICDGVCEILRWDRGRFAFRVDEVDRADGTAVPTAALLLEAGRRADAVAA